MTQVFLSLGTNMGDREAYLKAALEALSDLPQSQLVAVSAIYETAAWGLTDQADFLNLVCQLETDLSAETLLLACQQIEADLDRVRLVRWGPRTIDIDILLYGEAYLQTEQLTVPHPYLTQRAFVLVPLAELAKDLVIPGTGSSVAQFLQLLDSSDVRFYQAAEAFWKG